MSKKTFTLDQCDKCSNTEEDSEIHTCEVCGLMCCKEHWIDDYWHIPNNELCENCYTQVWRNMEKFKEKLKIAKKPENPKITVRG